MAITPSTITSSGNRIGLVSVVTVCLNARSTIDLTLRSVRRQSYPSVEHVVIDGGSTDGTRDIVRIHGPARFISEPDDGIYYAMQKGVQAASGDVVFFLNSGDTFYDDDVIRDVVTFFDKTGSDAVFGNLFPCYLRQGDTHDHQAFHDRKLMDLSYFNNRKLFFDESIHHQTVFYRKKIFDHCGFICDNVEANGEYHLNMGAFVGCGFSLKHFPRPICRFALGGKSTSGFTEEWQRYTRAREILRGKFFPTGPDLPIDDENEYLYYPVSFRIRLKIRVRKLRWYPALLRLRNFSRNLASKKSPGRKASEKIL